MVLPKETYQYSFCSLRARLGSLRILAASRILFKGRVRPLSVEDGSLQHPSTLSKTLYRVRSLTSVHLSNHHCCGTLSPFSSYHPLSWTIVPFLHTSVHNQLVGDGAVEIKPLSQEEARARVDEIRQLGWFTPNWEDATIDSVRVAERYWRK
jgi:hypothetical protein